MERLICLLIGYGFGCLQTAFFVGKMIGKVDIREHGSGNAGMTNVTRVVGFKAGLTVFICDVLKAIVAYSICAWLFNGGGSFFGAGLSLIPGLYAGLGVVLGHNFPFYLKFKGGKGISSSLGIMLALNWQVALIIYVVGLLIVVVTRYISLASLTMVLLFPVLLIILFHPGWEIFGVGMVMASMAWYLHRGNIQRLVSGTERKFQPSWKREV